jgi:hypothetical protein
MIKLILGPILVTIESNKLIIKLSNGVQYDLKVLDKNLSWSPFIPLTYSMAITTI